jgi:hypothetical protein
MIAKKITYRINNKKWSEKQCNENENGTIRITKEIT